MSNANLNIKNALLGHFKLIIYSFFLAMVFFLPIFFTVLVLLAIVFLAIVLVIIFLVVRLYSRILIIK
jgi:uncharacterized membrane protein